MIRLFLPLIMTAFTAQASNDPCEWFRLVENNLREMKAEGYSKRFVLDNILVDETGDYDTTAEDAELLLEAVHRVYEGYPENPGICSVAKR